MSDLEDSTVTYKAVSSPFGGMSDIGSSGVDGPPVMPEDPYAYVVADFQAAPSPDYVPGPEEPEQAPLSPEFVPEPVYPEFMPPEDEVLPTEEQPLHVAISPTANSPRYIPEFDPKEDPEEDTADYPVDGGDDDDDDDESYDDDEDDDEDVEEDKEEEEEHPAPADSVSPHVARLISIPSPPPSPLSPWSSPPPQIPSPPLPVSSPVPVSPPPLPASPTYPLGYRAAMIRSFVAMMRAVAPSTYILAPRSGILLSKTPPSGTPLLLPIPAPTSSPPLMLPSTDHRVDSPEVCLPPRKRLCIAFGPRYEVGESSSTPATRPNGGFRADYGFVATLDREIRRDPERDVGFRIIDTWDEMLVDMPGPPATDEIELGRRMTNLVTTVRQDINEIYGRLDEAQKARAVLSGQLNLLDRDRRSHAYTALVIEREARLSREAWGRSMDASDTSRSEVRALRTIVLA
ncbi:hypothetical protein Tco_1443164 [Tanacetum coccineum]